MSKMEYVFVGGDSADPENWAHKEAVSKKPAPKKPARKKPAKKDT